MTQPAKRVITVRLTADQMKDPVALLNAIRTAARNANVSIRVKKQPDAAKNGAAVDQQHIPAVHSKEFERLNARRAVLIFKKNREGLTEAERDEYERLDDIVFAAVNKKHPRTKFDWERLRQIEARLNASGG